MSERKALQRVDAGMGNKPALIVVDIVNGFTDPTCPLGAEAGEVVTANVALMDAFHKAGLPVVLTTVIYRSDDEATVFRARVQRLTCSRPIPSGCNSIRGCQFRTPICN